ncbi:MAG: GHKL domain-containing protein [Lachnospiraceae bacterium]|nr:GHKL domain-containing protein [Lachnospiraceae bacterium]
MKDFLQTVMITTLEMICCKIFFEAFLKRKVYEKKYKNEIVLTMLIVSISIVAAIQKSQNIFRVLIIIILIIMAMRMLYAGKFIQIVFCSLGFYGILVAIDIITLITIQYLIPDKSDIILQDPIRTTVLALICKTTLFICVIILNRKFKKEGEFFLISDLEWLRFLFFPLLTITSMLFFIMDKQQDDKYVLIISFGLILGNFLVFYMIKDIVYREKRMQEILVGQERTKNQTAMYLQMNEDYKEQRTKIHEFKNHMSCMNGLLELKEYEKATEYVARINKTWINEINYILTNHAIVNSVLNQKFKYAKGKGIPIIVKINDLEHLKMEDEDIVTLLANLLDNAIEAVDKIEGRENRIKFRMIYKDERLNICVRNPIVDSICEVDGRMITTKKDKRIHGIGMRNIKNVVQKYKGEMIYNCSNNYFTITIIIDNI